LELAWKTELLSVACLVSVLRLVVLFEFLPYLEELVRGLRMNRGEARAAGRERLLRLGRAMLFRRDEGALVAISQPSHAWLSGQLARAWGNELFAPPEPFDEVCLGAAQHDIAWLEWEQSPTFNPITGLPHEFREVDIATRVRLWRRGIDLAFGFGLYPALLVSLHAYTIHARFMPNTTQAVTASVPEEQRIMIAFLDAQQALRQSLLRALGAQARYRDFATAEACERNRLLIYAVDRLSLEICWGVHGDVIVPGVSPDGKTKLDLRLESRAGTVHELVVDPWPFSADMCHVVCEGHRLGGPFRDETEMREVLADPRGSVVIEAELRPR
jgi:hypothetical protein